MLTLYTKATRFLEHDLWTIDPSTLTPPRALALQTTRLVYGTVKKFRTNELDVRAMGLVYSTLLALVPLLALSFSVLKAFGVHNQLKDALIRFLAPLGEKAPEVATRIIGFVDNIKIGVLSVVGLALLFYTIIRLLQKIEESVNIIWEIDRPRSLARRFSDYMSVVLTGPVLIFIALGLKAVFLTHSFVQKLMGYKLFNLLFVLLSEVVPFVFICLSFTFLIIFIPNTRVKVRSALLGGLVAGVSWVLVGWVFSSFVATSTKYYAIYSSFAVLFLFILWLYLNWLILFIGAQVAYCHQHLDQLGWKRLEYLSAKLQEELGLSIMYCVGKRFHDGTNAPTAEEISTLLRHPLRPVSRMIGILEKVGLLAATADDPPAYLPSRDIGTIRLREVLDKIRGNEHLAEAALLAGLQPAERVRDVLERIEHALDEALDDDTLKDLVVEDEGDPAAGRPRAGVQPFPPRQNTTK